MFSAPFLTLTHRSFVNHLIADGDTLALTERFGRTISVWRRGLKMSADLPRNHRIEHMVFVNRSIVASVSSTDSDATSLFRIAVGTRLVFESLVCPVSRSSVLFIGEDRERVVVATRSGAIYGVSGDRRLFDLAPPARDGVSCVDGTKDGLMVSCFFSGRVSVRDFTRKASPVSSFQRQDHNPVRNVYCRRLGEDNVLVLTNTHGSSRITASVLNIPLMEWRHRVIIDGEVADIIAMRVSSDLKLFLLDVSGEVVCYDISSGANLIGRFRFPGIHSTIDQLLVVGSFVIHNEGVRVHIWKRTGSDDTKEGSRRLGRLNPILQDWFLRNGNSTLSSENQ